MSADKRSFLFLQGPCSLLFSRIADRLGNHGHAVHKINFNGGDIVYWSPRKSIWFREKLEMLPDLLESVWVKYGISDQILFGDCRPVHKAAAVRAERFGVRSYVFDGGYFRPLWITLEREGVNGHSLLPRDPAWFRETGRKLPEPPAPQRFQPSFATQATHDVLYHLAGISNPLFFPHYKNHVSVAAPIEYAAYLKRFALLKLNKRQEERIIDNLLSDKRPFFLLPLQLNSDAQIINHSHFENMSEVIAYVMRSFAGHAPVHARLVIKNHPLDMGLVDYPKDIALLAQELDIAGRIVYIESGNITRLLAQAAGTVTVNSTSGSAALELMCPIMTLADPIYNLPGLTFQGQLDAFWNALPKPDSALFDSFRKIVMYSTQINGSLYCNYGTQLAAENAARVLEAEKSPLEELL
ncbi:MAG: capsular biosynthesis protein [Methylovulum sp.]|nr:capsular biosynthesis protein [Methylovulum sp.]